MQMDRESQSNADELGSKAALRQIELLLGPPLQVSVCTLLHLQLNPEHL